MPIRVRSPLSASALTPAGPSRRCARPLASSLALVRELDETLDERQRSVSGFPPTAVDGERVPPVGDPGDLRDAVISLLFSERRVRDGPRQCVVLVAGDDQQAPRSGLLLSTFASVHGLRLAVAA
jgi:hypothetical protein